MNLKMEQATHLFQYILPENETLYKGMDTSNFDLNFNKPIWLSQQQNTAKMYGKYLHEVVTKRKLKLINITSPYFHSSFIDFLNNYYRFSPDSYNQKMCLLAPFGLPDETSQEQFLKKRGIKPIPMPDTTAVSIFNDVAFFYNKHKFSEHKLDVYLVKFLQVTYQQYKFDGYIAPCVLPSKYHFRFSDEICLFTLKDKDLLLYKKLVTMQHEGGDLRSFTVKMDSAFIPKVTQDSLHLLKAYGWKKPYELSEEGYIISPAAHELGEFWHAKQRRAKMKKIKELRKAGLLK